jgi:hypothetical protein
MNAKDTAGKPKSKKELEAEKLAQEEAEKHKAPQSGSGQFEFPNGAVYGQRGLGWAERWRAGRLSLMFSVFCLSCFLSFL